MFESCRVQNYTKYTVCVFIDIKSEITFTILFELLEYCEFTLYPVLNSVGVVSHFFLTIKLCANI